MRKKIVAGNWKMNKTSEESTKLVNETLHLLSESAIGNTIVILSPPFIALERVSSLIGNRRNIFTAAQNCHWEKSGAYTGEVSVDMIKSAGASYVIIGHSERRQYFNETNEQLALKVNAAMANGLTPIFCCGEPIEVREAGRHEQLVEEQIRKGTFQLTREEIAQLVIAYEPVWAIGTGKVATDEQAQQMHDFIRQLIAKEYGGETAENTSILYGGSCKPSNAPGLFSQPDIDGGLIGGASLVASDFVGIIRSF